MRERDTIYAIYKYLTPNSEVEGEPSYYLVRVFDNLGPVEREALVGAFTDFYPEQNEMKGSYLGPFANLSVLNKFAFHLVEKLDASKICLLSLTDFNSLLDCVSNMRELGENMIEVGSVLENIEKGERKKSIFSKILG